MNFVFLSSTGLVIWVLVGGTTIFDLVIQKKRAFHSLAVKKNPLSLRWDSNPGLVPLCSLFVSARTRRQSLDLDSNPISNLKRNFSNTYFYTNSTKNFFQIALITSNNWYNPWKNITYYYACWFCYLAFWGSWHSLFYRIPNSRSSFKSLFNSLIHAIKI